MYVPIFNRRRLHILSKLNWVLIGNLLYFITHAHTQNNENNSLETLISIEFDWNDVKNIVLFELLTPPLLAKVEPYLIKVNWCKLNTITIYVHRKFGFYFVMSEADIVQTWNITIVPLAYSHSY